MNTEHTGLESCGGYLALVLIVAIGVLFVQSVFPGWLPDAIQAIYQLFR